MSQRPDHRYPALDAARTQTDRLRAARTKLDAVWTPVRRALTAAAAFAGLPLAGVAGYLASNVAVDAALPISVAVLVGTPVLTYAATRLIQGLQQRIPAAELRRIRIAERCVEAGALPPEVAAPLDRAVDAYFTMVRISAEPVWRTVKLPGEDLLPRAETRLEELIDWSKRLKLIASRLHQLSPAAAVHPEHRETRLQYEAQCGQLAQAADLFVQAEAKMTRAFAAMSGDRSTGSRAAEQLREITATFDAVSEVITASGEWQPAPAPEEQVVRAGLGGLSTPCKQTVGSTLVVRSIRTFRHRKQDSPLSEQVAVNERRTRRLPTACLQRGHRERRYASNTDHRTPINPSATPAAS
ncbi:MAG: hypothetical protein K0Q72_5384 [Armatimonadetes bacterium]|nr:hypothetical protein [Armatimonadota bacterium]